MLAINKKWIIVILLVIIRILTLQYYASDSNRYTDPLNVIPGYTFRDIKDSCTLIKSGISPYVSYNIRFPVLFLALFNDWCPYTKSKELGLFLVLILLDLATALLILDYHENLDITEEFATSKSDSVRSYVSFILFVGYLFNPIGVYTNISLSFGPIINQLLLVLLLWFSNKTYYGNKRFFLPIIYSILIYFSSINFISLLAPLIYCYSISDNISRNDSNFSTEYLDIKSKKNKVSYLIINTIPKIFKSMNNIYSIIWSRVFTFIMLFSISLCIFHTLSLLIIDSMNIKDYINRFFWHIITFNNHDTLTPSLSIYWYIMTVIFPRFKLLFQMLFGVYTLLIIFPLIFAFRNTPTKIMETTIVMVLFFQNHPTLINYTLCLYLILFDFSSHKETHYSRFITGLLSLNIVGLSLISNIRHIWLVENRANANYMYSICIIIQGSLLLLTREWIHLAYRKQLEISKDKFLKVKHE
ncbi:hypothetical protein cand_004890 [Cryptosporidium andersoni]|uniref:GPI transamidase subunit PIG-U family protein n=1 Tax=Cryptosporidium andersoni TaxID=117008 RepID=A0A1J4ML01_9CRYT|nr:hypothetical protein cand_004890 [Cryptosporidium andersoni]